MHKFYKQRIYKKYKDEIWGKLILSNKFSYNKRSILLTYKDKVVKNFIRVRTKYKYFRKGFLKRLRYGLFASKKILRAKRIVNFYLKSQHYRKLRHVNRFVRKLAPVPKPYYKVIRRGRFRKRIFIRPPKRKPIVRSLKNPEFLSLLKKRKAFKKFKSLLRYNALLLSVKKSKRFSGLKCSKTPFLFVASKILPSPSHSTRNFKKYRFFLDSNNLTFTLKRKFNIKRKKVFFYSVHIASPRKKIKKWSNYGLKVMYYKKISMFFGFKKISKFLNFYNMAQSGWSRNEFLSFLILEGRLESLLFRINFFHSIYFVKKFIENGNVYVNNRQVTNSNHVLNLSEIVSINKRYFKHVYYFLKSRLKRRKVLLNPPSFIEVDYKLLVAMLIRFPKADDLTRPVSFNLYTDFLTVNK
jgi:ribosomal protein S4